MSLGEALKNLFVINRKRPPRQSAAPRKRRLTQRDELIRSALEIRRAKRRVFDDLEDEDRAKLAAITILTFLDDGKIRLD